MLARLRAGSQRRDGSRGAECRFGEGGEFEQMAMSRHTGDGKERAWVSEARLWQKAVSIVRAGAKWCR